MRWTKTDPFTVACDQLGATITRTHDRFIVRIGEHTRKHSSFVGARMLAEQMSREIEAFDHWGDTRVTRRAAAYRARKMTTMLGRRMVMAGTMAAALALLAAVLKLWA